MIFHLLIVDDEAPVRKGISRFINWEAIDCAIEDTASDGLEAIEKLRELSIDIVITDIRMPEADGLYLSQYISRQYPDIQVIILTGYADFTYAQTAIQYNVSDFLLKPISKEQVIKAVQNAQKKIIAARQTKRMEQTDLAFLKDQLLQELTDHPEDDQLLKRLEEYGISLDCYYVAAFQIMADDGEIKTLKELITSQHTEGCCRYNNLILCIFRPESQNLDKSGYPVDRCCEIIAMAKSMYGIEVWVGISGLHRGSNEYALAIPEAVHALACNFYTAGGVTCHSDATPSPGEAALTAEEALALNELETAMINRDFDTAASVVNSVFVHMKSRFAKSADVKHMCAMIYYVGFRVLMKKEKDRAAQAPAFQTGDGVLDGRVIRNIESSGDIFELQVIVKDFLEYVKKNMDGAEAYSKIVQQAIAYIASHLSEPLSLDQIAGEIPINPSYLSRTFKRETGHALTEYINVTRVERAKELLADGANLNYQVAEQVGFRDPAYFSSIFKKYSGMSPNEYRNRILKRGRAERE